MVHPTEVYLGYVENSWDMGFLKEGYQTRLSEEQRHVAAGLVSGFEHSWRLGQPDRAE